MALLSLVLCSLLTCSQGSAIPAKRGSRGYLTQPRDSIRPAIPLVNQLHLPTESHLGTSLNISARHSSNDTLALLEALLGPDFIFNLTHRVNVSSSTVPTGTVVILPSLSRAEPHTSGIVHPDLNALGQPTRGPLITRPIPIPSSLPQFPINNSTASSSLPTDEPKIQFKMASQDIFAEPIDTKKPGKEIKSRKDHPVPRKGIASTGPLQTNKFYSNFFLGDQLAPTFTFPYSIAWSGGKGASASWGMSISHVDAKQRVLGPRKFNKSVSYVLNPIGIQSLVLSAKELGNKTFLSVDSITAFSARVLLTPDNKTAPAVTFPLVQGMAYVTGQYAGSTPLIQSGVYFRTMTRVTKNPKENVVKYTFTLEDGTVWRVYGWRTKGDNLDLKVINNGVAESTKPFYGVIQVSKDPCTNGSEASLDDGAGIYPLTLKLTGSASDAKGSYTFDFEKDGHQDGNLYMYALPHHVDSFSSDTKKLVQKTQLQSTTKGLATLVKGTQWTMEEPEMPVNMGFAPWSPKKGSMEELSEKAKSVIQAAASVELTQNIVAQSNLDSMYFSGKVRSPRHKRRFLALTYSRRLPSLEQYCTWLTRCWGITHWQSRH